MTFTLDGLSFWHGLCTKIVLWLYSRDRMPPPQFPCVSLQIDRQQLFVSLSKMLEAAVSWEERATQILAAPSKLEDFEKAIRLLRFLSL